jgi:hypothetical protein
MVVHFYNPSSVGGVDKRIAVQGLPWAKTGDPVQNITKAKWVGGMAQVVECIFSKHGALV